MITFITTLVKSFPIIANPLSSSEVHARPAASIGGNIVISSRMPMSAMRLLGWLASVVVDLVRNGFQVVWVTAGRSFA